MIFIVNAGLFLNHHIMQDPRKLRYDEVTVPKPRSKKKATQAAPVFQLQGENIKGLQDSVPSSFKKTQKTKKRNLKQEVSPSFQHPERSTSDSLPESSTNGNDYRVLRRKYLLLEEESCTVGRALEGIEDDVKVLENEKLALLDELVVLEGLVDPSELQLLRP
ncbi:hypothetical protein Syun_014915 [Stephania yunnanensis]|uniref:Uncharacterized protein n=1 Tax=Stephania yunnanensis TaxID=152371 RepID=A0AAP0JME0_9MAGN